MRARRPGLRDFRWRLAACGLAWLVLGSGCASLSADGCRRASLEGWEAVGLADGRDGESLEARLMKHRQACEDVGVLPDPAGYRRGWQQGLAQHCTIETAYDRGRKGWSVTPALCEGVGDGSALVAANHRLGSNIRDLENEIQRAETNLRAKERRLYDAALPPEARQKARASLYDDRGYLSGLKSRLISAEAEPLIRRP